METTDYCNYELSKALKAAGFDEPCDHYWCRAYKNNDKIEMRQSLAADYNNDDWYVPHCSAPHIYQAQEWLREKKGIVVIAEPDWDSEDYCIADHLTGEWYFSVWKDGDRVHCNFDPNAEEGKIWMFEKYEQALSAGIAAALELIKKGE